MFALRARKHLTISFQECLGAWVRHCVCVSPSRMASQSFSSESQSLLVSWRLLIQGNMRIKSDPSSGVLFIGSWAVGPPAVPRLFIVRTSLSMKSTASVFRKMQFDRSVGAHSWELGAMPRSACIISFGIGLFLYGSGAHDWRNFPMSSRSVPSTHFCCIMETIRSRGR